MYNTVYRAAFWTMRKSDRQLPTDLTELVQLLARSKPQQQAAQQHTQQLATAAAEAAAAARAGAGPAPQPRQKQPQHVPQPQQQQQQQHIENQQCVGSGGTQHSMSDTKQQQTPGAS
jgi:hypothetical protein